MIPAALIGILAIARLGAIHAVVFGGFAPASLAQRIEASQPVAILTASCGIDGAKPPMPYKPFVQEALRLAAHRPARVIIWQRDQLRWDTLDKLGGERNWQRLVKSASSRGVQASCVPVKASDGLYIIYTSGTTGLPKGVLREAGGHAVGLHLSIRYLFGIHGPGDVMFCASDIGWVVGHSYILYAPLLVGATTVLFEGKPVGTPNAGTFWRIIEEYQVNTLFTAPTALRAIRRDDPDNTFFKAVGQRGGLQSLQALFLAGERSEPSIVTMYQALLRDHGRPGATVIDNWWSSESGSPISGIALAPDAAGTDSPTLRQQVAPLGIKPGSAGKAMPGFDVRIVDDAGQEVAKGTMGNIVLGMPLAPTGFRTLWQDEERFYRGYLKRFAGRWIDTGDAGMVDEDGYIHVMSRSDDIINVAAHRFSTGRFLFSFFSFLFPSLSSLSFSFSFSFFLSLSSLFSFSFSLSLSLPLPLINTQLGSIEQAISTHPLIAECCVVGIPDSLKGHLPFAFITLSTHPHPTAAIPAPALFAEVQTYVRTQIGAIASLGGMIQGKGMIPKTRSGKTLRRVLRELVENAVHGEFGKAVSVPATVEDASVVEVARAKVEEYFRERGGELHRATEGRAKL